LLLPSEICADLEEDIDVNPRAIKPFMEGLYNILTEIGAKTTATGATALPKIKIKGDRTALHLGKMVATSLTQQSLTLRW